MNKRSICFKLLLGAAILLPLAGLLTFVGENLFPMEPLDVRRLPGGLVAVVYLAGLYGIFRCPQLWQCRLRYYFGWTIGGALLFTAAALWLLDLPPFGDFHTYIEIGKSYMLKPFGAVWEELTAPTRTPYTTRGFFNVYLLFRVFGISLGVLIAANIAAYLGSGLLIFGMARMLFRGRRLQRLPMALFFFGFPLLNYAYLEMPCHDILGMFWTMLALYAGLGLFRRLRSGQRWRETWLPALGFGLSVCVLEWCRNIGLLVIAACGAAVCAYAIHSLTKAFHRGNWRRRTGLAVRMLILAVLLPGVMVVIAAKPFAVPRPTLSCAFCFTTLQTQMHPNQYWRFLHIGHLPGALELPYLEAKLCNDAEYGDAGLLQLWRAKLLRQYDKGKEFLSYLQFRGSRLSNGAQMLLQTYCRWTMVGIYVLAAAGLFRCLAERRRNWDWLMVLLFWSGISAGLWLTECWDRYTYMLNPVLALIAAYGCGKWQRRSVPGWPTAALGLSAALVVGNLAMAGLPSLLVMSKNHLPEFSFLEQPVEVKNVRYTGVGTASRRCVWSGVLEGGSPAVLRWQCPVRGTARYAAGMLRLGPDLADASTGLSITVNGHTVFSGPANRFFCKKNKSGENWGLFAAPLPEAVSGSAELMVELSFAPGRKVAGQRVAVEYVLFSEKVFPVALPEPISVTGQQENNNPNAVLTEERE